MYTCFQGDLLLIDPQDVRGLLQVSVYKIKNGFLNFGRLIIKIIYMRMKAYEHTLPLKLDIKMSLWLF